MLKIARQLLLSLRAELSGAQRYNVIRNWVVDLCAGRLLHERSRLSQPVQAARYPASHLRCISDFCHSALCPRLATSQVNVALQLGDLSNRLDRRQNVGAHLETGS